MRMSITAVSRKDHSVAEHIWYDSKKDEVFLFDDTDIDGYEFFLIGCESNSGFYTIHRSSDCVYIGEL